MNRMLEDRLGKLAMLIVFGYVAYQQVLSLLAVISLRDGSLLWELVLISKVAGAIFVSFIVYYTATRLPPRDSATGIAPRMIAIAGTYIMMVLIIIPTEEVGFEMQLASTILISLGTILSVYGLRRLGRSFSIMASARALVTEGPYRHVRHPLYAAELVTILGVVIAHWSPAAILVGQMWLLLQIKRIQHEETVLRKAFPEYDDYARRVPMLVPGIPQHLFGHVLPTFGPAKPDNV